MRPDSILRRIQPDAPPCPAGHTICEALDLYDRIYTALTDRPLESISLAVLCVLVSASDTERAALTAFASRCEAQHARQQDDD